MGADVAGSSILSTPLLIGLYAVAVGASVVSLSQWIQALRASRNHPSFQALGFRRWIMGVAVLKYMPQAASVHIKRYFVAFTVFMLSVLGIAAVAWLGIPQRPG